MIEVDFIIFKYKSCCLNIVILRNSCLVHDYFREIEEPLPKINRAGLINSYFVSRPHFFAFTFYLIEISVNKLVFPWVIDNYIAFIVDDPAPSIVIHGSSVYIPIIEHIYLGMEQFLPCFIDFDSLFE